LCSVTRSSGKPAARSLIVAATMLPKPVQRKLALQQVLVG
jgi:hypothetical protein